MDTKNPCDAWPDDGDGDMAEILRQKASTEPPKARRGRPPGEPKKYFRVWLPLDVIATIRERGTAWLVALVRLEGIGK